MNWGNVKKLLNEFEFSGSVPFKILIEIIIVLTGFICLLIAPLLKLQFSLDKMMSWMLGYVVVSCIVLCGKKSSRKNLPKKKT